jgi:hypothetical protein
MRRWTTAVAICLLGCQFQGCGQNPAGLSDEQLKTQLQAAEAEWKVTGAKVAESDAAYIPDPKIQAAYKRVKDLRTESAARAKAKR